MFCRALRAIAGDEHSAVEVGRGGTERGGGARGREAIPRAPAGVLLGARAPPQRPTGVRDIAETETLNERLASAQEELDTARRRATDLEVLDVECSLF